MGKNYTINILKQRDELDEVTENSVKECLAHGVSLRIAEKYDFIRLGSMSSSCSICFSDNSIAIDIMRYLDSENSTTLKSLVSNLTTSNKYLLDNIYSGLLGVLQGLKQYSSFEKHDDIPFKVSNFRYSLLECLYYRPTYLHNLDSMVDEELVKISEIGLDKYIATVKGVHFWKIELDIRSFASFIAILHSISEKDSSLVKLVIVSVLLFRYGASFYDFFANFNEIGYLYFIISGVFRFDYTNGYTPLGDIMKLYTDNLDDYIVVVKKE